MKTQRIIELEPVITKVPAGTGHHILPWHVKTMANLERWYLNKLYDLNPDCDRIVRFYTFEDCEGRDYFFKCPNYCYDTFSNLYEDFVETSDEIGNRLTELFSVTGEYYYDVKITLNYFQTGNPTDGYDWDMRYDWVVLKTDNPRCVLGSPIHRKNCSYLRNRNSSLEIRGYKLSGNYKKFSDALWDLSTKTIVVHSKTDAKKLLRVLRFLGVTSLDVNGVIKKNLPTKNNHFTRTTFGYGLYRVQNHMVACAIHKDNLPANPQQFLDIDEFIVKQTIKSKIRDILE